MKKKVSILYDTGRFYLSRWQRGGFWRNLSILVGGTAIAEGISVVISPLLTRLYTPDDLGILTIYASVVSILVVFSSLRYEVAIPLPKEDKVAINLVVLSLIILVGMSSLVIGIISLLGQLMVVWVNLPELKPYLWLLPLGLLGGGGYQIFSFWAIRKKDFPLLAQTKLSKSIGAATTQLGLGFLGFTPIGLLFGNILGRASGIGTLTRQAWHRDRGLLKNNISFSQICQVATRYRRFPLLASWGALLNTIGLQIPVLLLASFYGPEVVGWFALGQKVLGTPLHLISGSAGQVYLAEFAEAANKQPERLHPLFITLIRNMFLITFPYVALMMLFAPSLFLLVFGSEWGESGAYVQVLGIMVLVQSVASPTGGVLDVTEKQNLHLFREVIRIMLMSSAVILAQGTEMSSLGAITSLSVAGTTAYIFYLLVSWYAIHLYLQGQ